MEVERATREWLPEISASLDEWEQCLEALNTRTTAVRNSVRDLIRGSDPNATDGSSFVSPNEMQQQLQQLRIEVTGFMEKMSEEGSLAAIEENYHTSHNSLGKQLQGIQETLKTLEKLSHLENGFEKIDVILAKESDYDEAVKILHNSTKLIDSLTNDDFDNTIIRALKAMLRRKKVKLQHCASKRFDTNVVFDDLRLTIKQPVNGALELLESLGYLKSVFDSSFSQKLVKDLFMPIIDHVHANVSLSKSHESYPSQNVLEIAIDSENKPVSNNSEPKTIGVGEVVMIFRNVVTVLDFLYEQVFCGNREWFQTVSKHVWGQYQTNVLKRETDCEKSSNLCSLLSMLLLGALPEDVSGLLEYMKLSTTISQFEEHAMKIGLVLSKDTGLATYLKNAEAHLSDKKRSKILADARDMILDHYQNAPVVTSTEKHTSAVFSTKKYAYTDLAQKLVALSEASLLEAAACGMSSSNHLAQVLFHTSRDVLQMFQYLVPNIYKSSLEDGSQSRMALLFHNDCLHIANRLLSLGSDYRAKFPTDMRDAIVTVDMVPSFRETARLFLSQQVNIQIDSITSKYFVESIHFVETDDVVGLVGPRFIACGETFGTLMREWKSVLADDVYADVASRIANPLLVNVISFVTMKMHTKETRHVNEILALREILQGFKAQMVKMIGLKEVENIVPSILALTQLCTVLERYISPHIYQDMVSTGQLSSLTTDQVRGFARYLFPKEELEL